VWLFGYSEVHQVISINRDKGDFVPAGKYMGDVSESLLFVDASNRMHASSDIPAILRIAVQVAMQLVHGQWGTAGLRIEDQLVFTEYSDGDSWYPHPWRFGTEQACLGELIRHHDSVILQGSGAAMAGRHADALLAVPVMGKEHDLLACLMLFDNSHSNVGEGVCFDAHDQALLEQLASMVSVAIENSIQLMKSSRIEMDLEKSVATYRTLVEQIPAITYIATLDRSRILFVSPQIEAVLGFKQDDFLANQEIWSQQIHPEDRSRVLAEVRQSLDENIPFHSEYRICAKDGRDIWVKDAASKVQDQDKDLYFQGIVQDISAQKSSEKQLMMMAHYDQLTGLANRVLFHDRLEQVVAHSKRHGQQFAVLYLDIDGFKAVNDDLGHHAGDVLLTEIASRLKAHVREVDTVARMGGDEFTIILDDVKTRETIELISNKLVGAIAEPYAHIDTGHAVTMSMGIALYPEDSENRDVLITAADNAMYRAKNSGKNCYCFHQDGAMTESG